MSLKVPIDHLKLIDSPFDGANSFNFEFTHPEIDGLTQDIINGHKTCYLISGYRGSGKSSLIKKLELEVKKSDHKFLFVYLNFAKHEPRSILLRKLIRNFYLQLTDKPENIELYQTLKKDKKLALSLERFFELYERTFYEVSKNSNEKKSVKTTVVFGYNANLKDLFLTGASVATLATSILGLDLSKWYSYLPLGGSVFWNVLQFRSLEKKKEKEKTESEEKTKNSFYDDEIAEYYIVEILKQFKDYLKPVFILDELDKIDDDKLVEYIINELKPIMLSGLASFIVVAGQSLYYGYYASHTKDDNPLSTLFSKVHHVSLSSVAELKILFFKLMRTNQSELSVIDNHILEAYINYLILESLRVPRKFISLVRQNLVWEGNLSFIEIERSAEELSIYTKTLNRIELIDDQTIASEGFPMPIRDYFNMQLLIMGNKIIKSQGREFTHETLKDG